MHNSSSAIVQRHPKISYNSQNSAEWFDALTIAQKLSSESGAVSYPKRQPSPSKTSKVVSAGGSSEK